MIIVIFASMCRGQPSAEENVAVLIQRLGDANFIRRSEAMEELKKRADAEPFVRKAIVSPNAEVASRAKQILDYYAEKPIRELDNAIRHGQADKAAKLLGDWPVGEYEDAAAAGIRNMIEMTMDNHFRSSKSKINIQMRGFNKNVRYNIIPLRDIRSISKKPMDAHYWLRSGIDGINLTRENSPWLPNSFFGNLEIVTSGGPTRVFSFGNLFFILAAGDVDIIHSNSNAIVISGGNIHVKADANNSLLVAKNNITIENLPVHDLRLISGKSVIVNRKPLSRCEVTENEPNPLGYIRWSDVPKVEPKKK